MVLHHQHRFSIHPARSSEMHALPSLSSWIWHRGAGPTARGQTVSGTGESYLPCEASDAAVETFFKTLIPVAGEKSGRTVSPLTPDGDRRLETERCMPLATVDAGWCALQETCSHPKSNGGWRGVGWCKPSPWWSMTITARLGRAETDSPVVRQALARFTRPGRGGYICTR